MSDGLSVPILALLGLAVAAAVARGAEHDMYAYPCPKDEIWCHQSIVDTQPGQSGMLLKWVGDDFVWLPACGSVDAKGLVSALWPARKDGTCHTEDRLLATQNPEVADKPR